MIEDMEFDMRSNLNELYVMKTREIVNTLHRSQDGPVQKSAFVNDLNAAVLEHGHVARNAGGILLSTQSP